MKKIIKKTGSPLSQKKSLKDRLEKKKADLKKGGGVGSIIFIKEGSLRVRTLPVGEDNDFTFEVIQFYLGSEIKGVISPATIGKPCAIMEKYNKLKSSKKDDDKELAKKMVPKRKFLMPVAVYKDGKGKEVDPEKSGKMVMLTKGMAEAAIDLFLDDDWGDMTNPLKGYDLKLSREGSGMTDTEYKLTPCKNTPTPKAYRKEVDLRAMVESILPSYEETKEFLDKYLNNPDDDDNGKSSTMDKKKKKIKRDI